MRLYAIIVLIALVSSCSHTLPDIPEAPKVDTQTVYLDKPCIVRIEAVESIHQPDYPPFDEGDPKGWAKEVRRITKLIISNLKAENEALRSQISDHNKLEPQCSD